MEITGLIGIVAGICTSAASVPQIVKTIQKKEAADVSPAMFMVLLAGNALWAWYGLRRADLPVTVTNCVSVLLDLAMVFLHFKYRKK